MEPVQEDFTLATPVVEVVKDLSRLPDSLDVTRQKRIAEAKVAAQSGDKFARTWLIDTARETGDADLIEFLRLSGLAVVDGVVSQALQPPQEYTYESVTAMPLTLFKALMKSPAEKVKIEAAVAKGPTPAVEQDLTLETPAEVPVEPVVDPVEEERLRLEAETKATQEVEAARLQAEADQKAANERAEEARKVQEEERKKAEEAKPKQKIVRSYQAKDENGNPIGRPTHLEAETWEEMTDKLQQAHENAVRYAERLKNRKLTPLTPEPTPLTDDELLLLQKDLESGTAAQKADAIRKIVGDQVVKDNQVNRQELKRIKDDQIANKFCQLHKDDYNSCTANAIIIGNYLREKNLGFTLDNLEAAFDVVQDKLAPVQRKANDEVPAPVVLPTAVNPALPLPVNQPAAAVHQAQPVVAEPAPVVPVAAAVPEVVPAPVANPIVSKAPTAGIQPGSMTGTRPTTQGPAKLSKQDIINMPKEEYKRRMKNPDFKTYVNTLFASK